jgi:hypothetical protein
MEYASNPDLIEQHGRQSRKIALQLDWSKISDQYFQLYHDTIQGPEGKSNHEGRDFS